MIMLERLPYSLQSIMKAIQRRIRTCVGPLVLLLIMLMGPDAAPPSSQTGPAAPLAASYSQSLPDASASGALSAPHKARRLASWL